MQPVKVDRDNWATLAQEANVSLELLAVLTGVSYSAVYRYKTGSRIAPDAWLAKVGLIIADRSIRKEASA